MSENKANKFVLQTTPFQHKLFGSEWIHSVILKDFLIHIEIVLFEQPLLNWTSKPNSLGQFGLVCWHFCMAVLTVPRIKRRHQIDASKLQLKTIYFHWRGQLWWLWVKQDKGFKKGGVVRFMALWRSCPINQQTSCVLFVGGDNHWSCSAFCPHISLFLSCFSWRLLLTTFVFLGSSGLQ